MRLGSRRRRSRAKRERITFRRNLYTTDAYGTRVISGTEVVTGLSLLPAWYEYVGGTETFRGQQLEATVSGVFELRMPAAKINPEWHITHVNDGNKQYEIVAVKPAEDWHEGGFRHTLVFVRAHATEPVLGAFSNGFDNSHA